MGTTRATTVKRLHDLREAQRVRATRLQAQAWGYAQGWEDFAIHADGGDTFGFATDFGDLFLLMVLDHLETGTYLPSIQDAFKAFLKEKGFS